MDDDDMTEEERILFDQYVKEEMEKLERQVQMEASKHEAYSPTNQFGKAESYDKLMAGSAKVMAKSSEWAEAERRVKLSPQRSPDRHNFQYADSYDRANDVYNQQSIPKAPPMATNSNDSFGPQFGERGNAGKMKQQEYARLLRADQEAKVSMGSARQLQNDYLDQRAMGNSGLPGQPKSNPSSYTEYGDAASKRDRQAAYAKQLADDKANTTGLRLQESSYSNPSSKSTSHQVSPRGDVGFTRSLLGNSGRNILGEGSGPQHQQEDEKRAKQRKYYEELTAAATAAPIASERVLLRKPKSPHNFENGGVGLNVGNPSGAGDKYQRKEQQRAYYEQVAEAAKQPPIPAEYVRRNRMREEVGGGSEPTGQYYQNQQTFRQNSGSFRSGEMSPRSGGVLAFPSDNDSVAAKKRLQQAEYSRQLKEDASRGPILSPRSTFQRRPQSPMAPFDDRNPRSPSAILAKGLSTMGCGTSIGLKRAQQAKYANDLERDLENRKQIEAERGASGRRQMAENGPAAAYRNRLTSPGLGPTNAFPLAPDPRETDAKAREKQRQYAEALQRDQQVGPIESSRANVRRVVSPSSGMTRRTVDVYGNAVDASPGGPLPTQQQSQLNFGKFDSAQSNAISGFGGPRDYEPAPSRYEPPRQPSFDADAEERYRQFAEQMKRELYEQESYNKYEYDARGPTESYGPPSNASGMYSQQPSYQIRHVAPVGGGADYYSSQQPKQPVGPTAGRADSRQRGRSSGGGASSFSIGGY